jgi:hypothetical protein
LLTPKARKQGLDERHERASLGPGWQFSFRAICTKPKTGPYSSAERRLEWHVGVHAIRREEWFRPGPGAGRSTATFISPIPKPASPGVISAAGYVPRQLTAPEHLSGCEEAGHSVSPDISGSAPELFHSRQERGASHRNAGTHGHSDVRTTLNIYTQTVGPEVIQKVNEVTNRILGLGEKGEPGSIH